MNRKLIAGLALLLALLALAAGSGRIAPHERGYSKSTIVERIGEEDVYFIAPEPPGRHYLLGSDVWGFDLFSEMLHGLRWTLGIVAAVAMGRALLGLLFGLALAFSGKGERRRRGFSPLASVPGFILAAFALYPITMNSSLPPLVLFLAQAAVLLVVELPAVAAAFGARTAGLLGKPFVESARLAGAGPAWIVSRHLLPFLAIDFVEALPVQALSVAALVGKLGVVKIFVGGTNLSFEPLLLQPARGEWLGLLGYHYFEALRHPWLFFAPFAGWLLVLAAVGLLASGTKEAYARARRLSAA